MNDIGGMGIKLNAGTNHIVLYALFAWYSVFSMVLSAVNDSIFIAFNSTSFLQSWWDKLPYWIDTHTPHIIIMKSGEFNEDSLVFNFYKYCLIDHDCWPLFEIRLNWVIKLHCTRLKTIGTSAKEIELSIGKQNKLKSIWIESVEELQNLKKLNTFQNVNTNTMTNENRYQITNHGTFNAILNSIAIYSRNGISKWFSL